MHVISNVSLKLKFKTNIFAYDVFGWEDENRENENEIKILKLE